MTLAGQAPAGHTPGPWRDVSASLGKRDYAATVATGADGMAIDCTRSGRTREEDFANARLIAAAPDLLEALEEVSHYFFGEHYFDHPTAEKIRNALARATGSQP